MLTEESITQQLHFHKLPFPEDSGRGVDHGGAGGITALFQNAGLQPSSERSSSCLLTRGRGDEPEGGESHLGRRILSQPGFLTQGLIQQIHLECCVNGRGYSLISVSKEERKLDGDDGPKYQVHFESSCMSVRWNKQSSSRGR